MLEQRSFVALTRKDFPKEERPDCPSCGAGHTLSCGTRWQCGECGKQWEKEHRPRIADNPPCMYCGGKVHKRGQSYTCCDCGKSRQINKVKVKK